LLRCAEQRTRMFPLRALRPHSFVLGEPPVWTPDNPSPLRSPSSPVLGAALVRRFPASWPPSAQLPYCSDVLNRRSTKPLSPLLTPAARQRSFPVTSPCSISSNTLPPVDSTFGRVDILVNNAGVGGFNDPLHNLPPEDWDRIINTNLRGVYFAIRTFAPIMIRAYSGHIINVSSLAGKNALPNGAAYAASKWGLNGLTYSVAEELRRHNVRV